MENYLILIPIILIGFLIYKKFATNSAGKNKILTMKNENKKLFLVDVRQPDEFRSGSVKNAINIPLGDIPKRMDEFKGKENIIVFCKSGMRSGQAVSILAQNGITDVINGGTWQNVATAIN